MKTRLALALVVLVLLAPLAARAENEVGWIEKFALAPDREAVLDQLLPGTEDYYYFHALQYQNTHQAAKLAAILEQWAKRFPDSEQRKVIENRAALLGYDSNPQKTLKYLRDKLNPDLGHEPDARDEKPDLPTKLDPATISRAAFQQAALEDTEDLSNVSDEALGGLIRDKAPLNAAQIRDLLHRLKRPDVPGLVDVVLADLQSKESRGFGEFDIHRALLPEQMDELARRMPELYGNAQFVNTRLRKLAPGADADAEFDPVERIAWLDRAWAYAKNLSPSFNSLKAQILLQRLKTDRAAGIYDKARFLEYIKIPRRTGYANLEFLRRAEAAAQTADLNADLEDALGSMPLIHSDDGLVRDYLLHLFKDEPDWEPWAAWLRDSWIKPIFAEAKIINGIGDPEKWASLLSPQAFQALKERVDVDFSPVNPQFLAPEDDVRLDVFLKNTPKVIVKIYEINTLSYFLTEQRQLNTDLALDGLVPNRELTQDFSNDEAGRSPFRRTLRTFQFPELKGRRGAWVIEFIGGGKSSRALVRKGQWSLLERTGVAGDMITVLDEKREPVKDAVVWFGGRKFTPDAKLGQIIVPFAPEPGTKPIILADAAGDFATLASFDHRAENYTLDTQIHVEREQLLAGRQATIAVRAALRLNDTPVSLDLLQDVKLTITSTTLDGVATTREEKIDKLDPAKVYTQTIAVPDRLATLDVDITGQVEKISAGGEKEDLNGSESFTINGIDKTTKVYQSHLSRFGGTYVFELLGKNGEPIPDREVAFEFHHPDFTKTIPVSLRTDDKGRIDCGALREISDVDTDAPSDEGDDQTTHSTWELVTAGRTHPESIHALAGEPIDIPWTGGTPARISLLEQRRDTFVADRRSAVSLIANGKTIPVNKAAKEPVSDIVLTGLSPGDYLLTIPNECTITVRVTAGKAVQNWLLSPNRELEVTDAAPLNITRVQQEPGALVVQLANAGRFARVHVAATRFLESANPLSELGSFTRPAPAQGTPAKLPNLFAGGRSIGDEYRYILERRYTKIFPGNMLPRPGLILNPWETRSTDVHAQAMEQMQRPAATPGARPAKKQTDELPGGGKETKEVVSSDESANLDFLAQSAPVLYNLVPDEKGVVRIDLKALGDRQYVQIYAEDLQSAAFRTVALAEAPTKFQDLRLVRNLDPQKPFTEKKEITVLAAGQTLTLTGILTADLETYDSLQRVFALLTTLDEDGSLEEFAWVTDWPKLSDEEKRAKYSEFACHELNFFLSRKDPAFFGKVVLPYLRNKKDRTFMDDYLLGNDLHRYLEPWAFSQLNAVECCLLAQHLPGEAAAIARHERGLWEMLPVDTSAEDRLFETALRGRALTDSEADGLESEKGKQENAADASNAPAHSSATAGQTIEQVKQWFIEAQGFYDTGRFDLARQRCEHILNVDPYNRAAREFEEKIERTRDDYGLAAYNHTRAKLAADMDNAWAAPVRAPGSATVPAATPTAKAGEGNSNLNGGNTDSGGQAKASPAAPAQQIGAIAGVFSDPQFQIVLRDQEKKSKPNTGKGAGNAPPLEDRLSSAPSFTVVNRSGNAAISADAINALLFPTDAGELQRQREQVRQFFRSLGPAKEWAENNYYHVSLQEQNGDLIPINTFWRDYAAWDGKSPFVSAHIAEAGRSFTEMMLALAVLDLPFDSPKHSTHSENGQFTLTAAGPLIAFHKEITPAAPAPGQAPLLVSQNFFRADDRYREEGDEKFDKYVTDEFVAGVVYGANIVVTNPASARQKVSVLLQIPRGALPINGSKATDSRRLQLEPFSTQTLEYYFYFPAPSAEPLPHYPVHVSRDEQIVGEAKPFAFKVVRKLTQEDKTSWDYISQSAKEADVFAFLERTNIERLDLERVAWRARKSASFFHKLVALMEKRHVYSEPIYRYALVHNAAGPLAAWLRPQDEFINECGPYLDSKLLKIDPIERRSYEHLEYLPLVNQRTHRLGDENRIANPVFREQYQHLMRILAHKPTLDAADQMSVVYYLFLQDRVEEALARFHAIVPEKLPSRLQYDYFRCSAAFYEEQPAVARGLAQQYADYPVDRWRKLFVEVAAQLDEIEGKQPVRPDDKDPNREKQQGELAASEPSFDFKVENRQIALTWKNLREVTIRYYLMDPEFLFSASPFVTENSGRFSIIKATRTDRQALPEDKDQLSLPLPAEFTKANVLVEILGAGLRKAQTYHANTLKLTMAENYGRLEVHDDVENKPVTKAYVKVYARLKNGVVRFYKDGYTDLRGRFDYASLNSSTSGDGSASLPSGGGGSGQAMNYQMLSPAELTQVARFSVLVLSEAHGAEVREATPPAP